MKPRDKGGVVNERLDVYGVENLKVAGTDDYSTYSCSGANLLLNHRPEYYSE
jgi:hypothetical protein